MSAIKTFIEKQRQKKETKKKAKELNEFRNSLASCGDNLILIGTPEVVCAEKLAIGSDCRINSSVYINARSGITIGNNVTLSHGVKIVSTGYDIERWVNTVAKNHTENTPVYIGDYCWIGINAVILPGIKISGEHVIIGAGAVVTKDITENRVIVAGVPAKVIKHI